MRRRIIWIAILTTMTFWLGCAGSGGDQNYKILNEDPPMFQADPDPPQTALPFSMIQVAQAQDSSTDTGATDEGEETEEPMPPATQPTEAAIAITRLTPPPAPSSAAARARVTGSARFTSDNAPSMTGLSRSRWPKTHYDVESGRTQHGALLFHDVLTPSDHFPTVREGQSTEIQMRSSLANPWAENWDVANTRSFFEQPLKFALDLIALPVHATVCEPVWKPEYTPPLTPFDVSHHIDFTAIPTSRWPTDPTDFLPPPRPVRYATPPPPPPPPPTSTAPGARSSPMLNPATRPATTPPAAP